MKLAAPVLDRSAARKLLLCLGPLGISILGRLSRPSAPGRASRTLAHWASICVTAAMAGGVLLGIDPRVGGRLVPRLLSLFGHSGFRGAAFSDVIWATIVTNALLILLAGAAVSARRMYSDPILLTMMASPVPTRLLVGSRLGASALDLLSVGRVTLLPLIWVTVTGPSSFEAATSGLVLGLTSIAAGSLLGFQTALLTRWIAERAGPLRLMAPLLTLAPALLVVPLGFVGPAAISWRFTALSLGFTGVLALITLALGPAYRAGVYSAEPALQRRARRATGVVGDRSGPVCAVINRDLSLLASNPVTWFRLAALVGLVAVYPIVESRLGAAKDLLAPGVLGLPFAYAILAWYLAVSEIGVSLGQVDLALRLTVASAACTRRTMKLGSFLSNAVCGVPPCIAAGLAVLALAATPYRFMDALAYSMGLTAVAAGQAALGALLARGARGSSHEVPVEASGWMALLLEQVPLSPEGLRTLGLLASHLVVIVAVLAHATRTLGVVAGCLLSLLVAVLPVVFLAFEQARFPHHDL